MSDKTFKILASLAIVLLGVSELALSRQVHDDPFICDLESQFPPGTWRAVESPEYFHVPEIG